MSNSAIYYALSSILEENYKNAESYKQAILELMYHLEDESNSEFNFYKMLEEKNKIHQY